MRRFLAVALLLFATLISGCSFASNNVKNISISLNEEFEGYFLQLGSERVYLEWESGPLGNGESYSVKTSIPGDVKYGGFEDILTVEKDSPLLVSQGNKIRLNLQVSYKTKDASLFPHLASSKSRSTTKISVTKLGDGGSKVISESTIDWVRPDRRDVPADPVLINTWYYDPDGYYRYSVRDVSILTFDTFPDRSIEKCLGICASGSNSDGVWAYRDEIWGTNVKGKSKKVVLERTVTNEKGSSNPTTLTIVSGEVPENPSSVQSNPFDRIWKPSEKSMEILGKTVWCIDRGYKDYDYSKDECTNSRKSFR